MREKFRTLSKAYKMLLKEIYRESPIMVILTFIAAIISGLITPLTIFVNRNILNGGISIAEGKMAFDEYIPYLVLFVIVAILPSIIQTFIYGFVEPRSMLILRTSLKGRMLKKIKKMEYGHFEDEGSMEIIDKAYNRAEQSARHMFPMYVTMLLSHTVASIGVLWYLFSVRWWLVLTVLIPFLLEIYFITKNNYNIYDELETYWNRERQYGILGGFLRSREYIKENKVFGASDYLIDTYKSRLNSRNREYEKYYFKHLKHHFTENNITKIASLVNPVILLILFVNGQMDIGLFISLSLLMFGDIYNQLMYAVAPIIWSGYHINFFNYYEKYFDLSEDEQGESEDIPTDIRIEFKDVWFIVSKY